MSTSQTDPPDTGKSGIPTWVKVLVPVIATGGLAVTGVMVAITVFVITAWLDLPLPVFGFDEPPEQPIAFSHTVHAGTDILLDINGAARVGANGEELHGLGLDCTFCHRTVTTSAQAGIPAVQLCSFCHRVVGSESNVQFEQLRGAGLEPFVGAINWQRVHRLPDSVRFVHDPHIRFLTDNPGVIGNADSSITGLASAQPAQVCSTCHGSVATMEKVKQVEPLKMGQCVNCHRDNNAPVDCSTCHF